jgi:hypothetical protein
LRAKRAHSVPVSAPSTTITVTGRISGSSASGKLNVNFTKTLGTTSAGLLDFGACQLKTSWTAKEI